MSVYAVIMAGGVGSRFYPMSTNQKPKQFLPLFSEKSMIRETYERVLPLVGNDHIMVSSNASFGLLMAEALPEIDPQNLLLEPSGRNTAPALGLAAKIASQRDPDAIIVSVHSDHFIKREARFLNLLKQGIDLARKGRIVTLGITPEYPETGYGYIRRGNLHHDCNFDAYEVDQFIEKPDLKTAQAYVEAGKYLWNAGMFIFNAQQFLEEMKIYCGDLFHGLSDLSEDLQSDQFAKQYAELPSVAIDVAVMEKSSIVSVIPCDVGWSDVGSFYSLFHVRQGDSNGNVKLNKNCDLYCIDSRANLVATEGSKSVALIGVSDLMIVDTPECLLIGQLDRSQEVKEIQAMKSLSS